MGDKSSVENEPQKRPTLFPGAHPGGGCDRVRVYEPLPPCFPITHHLSFCYFTYTEYRMLLISAINPIMYVRQERYKMSRECYSGITKCWEGPYQAKVHCPLLGQKGSHIVQGWLVKLHESRATVLGVAKSVKPSHCGLKSTSSV